MSVHDSHRHCKGIYQLCQTMLLTRLVKIRLLSSAYHSFAETKQKQMERIKSELEELIATGWKYMCEMRTRESGLLPVNDASIVESHLSHSCRILL